MTGKHHGMRKDWTWGAYLGQIVAAMVTGALIGTVLYLGLWL